MPNVTLSGHTGIKESSFNIVAAFEEAVVNFEASDIAIVASTGNGITGVTIGDITGSGADRTIPINLPDDAIGSFTFDITGEVTPEVVLPRVWGGVSLSGFATSVDDVDHLQTGGTTDILVIAYMTGTDEATFINSVNATDYPVIVIQQGSNTQTVSFSSKGSQINIPGVSGGAFRYFVVSNIDSSGLTGDVATTISFRGDSEEVTLDPVTIQYNTENNVDVSLVNYVDNLKTDDFSVEIRFGESITGFSSSNINISSLIIAPTFASFGGVTITGSGTDYTLSIDLPEERRGSFTLGLIGSVTDADGNSLDISFESLDIEYNTITRINANLTGHTGTKTGTFQIMLSFAHEVTDLEEADIDISAVGGNGITGVSFVLSGTGLAYILTFTIPDSVEGSFSIDVTGQVTLDPVSVDVIVDAVTVAYDTITEVQIDSSDIEYVENDLGEYQVEVDIVFEEALIFLYKENFSISKISGDDIEDLEYYLIGSGASYKLIFIPKLDRSGVFEIGFIGEVTKVNGLVMEEAIFADIQVPYNTKIPNIVDYEISGSITVGAWDVYFEYDEEVTGIAWAKFIQEGANLSNPEVYRYIGSGIVDIHASPAPQSVDLNNLTDSQGDPRDPNTDDLNDVEGDWVKLDIDSGVAPNENEIVAGQNTDFEDDGNTTPSKYFLFRFVNVQSHIDSITGAYNLTMIPGTVRGPDN